MPIDRHLHESIWDIVTCKIFKANNIFFNTRREELDSQLEQARDKIDQLMADGEHEKARVQELESVINKTENKVIILIMDNLSK